MIWVSKVVYFARKLSMDPGLFLAFFAICHSLPLSFSAQENSVSKSTSTCPEHFECGNLGTVRFPFFNVSELHCGLCWLDCTAPSPKIEFGGFAADRWFHVRNISIDHSIMTLDDLELKDLLASPRRCESFNFNYDMRIPTSPFISYTILQNITLFRCSKNSQTSQRTTDILRGYQRYHECDTYTVYYPTTQNTQPVPPHNVADCAPVTLPTVSSWHSQNIFEILTAEFDLQWQVSEDCYSCHNEGKMCLSDWKGHSRCASKKGKKNLRLILAIVIPGCASIFIVLALYLIWRRKKGINAGSYFLSRNTSEPSSKPDLEGGSVYFGVPVFSYCELEEATNNFDVSKELGDGGFGTVYFGKLRDGREVAVKRLYEHNFKRMEQFMNEIQILTRLRHPNLVTLYGCTSRRSRELLLVYEYIPNGTVADHLHGDRAKDKYLTWPHRMNIAIETADALAYLHKSDIIHRDVKTNNILIDNNFCVKVADFGLSRLFPTDVTHISTAPQGTPGYVDPEYHQCYQLTDRSDVYSFGVVLIELISSMPAVDISRHRHEINLANLAINRIQRCAFDELIDPSLGYKSDSEVMRMTTSVAELAFRCLQLEKDMRPKMDEVLETLKEIQNCKEILVDKTNEISEKAIESRGAMAPLSPESDEQRLLFKNVKLPSSPNSVADVWVSSSSTASTST